MFHKDTSSHSLLYFLLLAYSAYTYEELQHALKLACPDIRFVDVIESFPNFSQTIAPYLNNAASTPGE
jgi:hypothetical protein